MSLNNIDNVGATQAVSAEAQGQAQAEPQVQLSTDDLLKKLQEQSVNLSGQRSVINDAFATNKKLETENAELKAKLAALENLQAQAVAQPEQQVQTQLPNSNNTTLAQDDAITALQKRLDAFEAERHDQAVRPVIELMKDFNVPQNEVPNVFNTIKQKFGYDLYANPNVDTAKLFLTDLYGGQAEPMSLPQGGYANTNMRNMSMEQQAELAYQQNIAAVKAEKSKKIAELAAAQLQNVKNI